MASMTADLRDTSESFDVAKKWISGYLADLNENTPSHDGEPDMDKISEKICNLCMSFTTDDLQTELLDKTQQSSSPCPPSKSPSPMTLNTVDNPYLPTITRAYSLLMEAVDANEADGWQYWGEKQGVTKYRKDPKDSLAIFRGEKVLVCCCILQILIMTYYYLLPMFKLIFSIFIGLPSQHFITCTSVQIVAPGPW